MLFLQTIIEMCLWTGRTRCDFKSGATCLNEGGFLLTSPGSLFLHPFCTAVDVYHGHTDQLSHHLHALHWHAYDSPSLPRSICEANIGRLYVFKGKSSSRNAAIFQKKRKKKTVSRNRNEQSELYCEGTLTRGLLESQMVVFHSAFMQDCPRSTTYAIYSQSVRSNSLVATGI